MSGDDPGSVTLWLDQLKAGSDPGRASEELWRRYYMTLLRLAKSRLDGASRGAADEEDVVLSAFDSFFSRAERGQFEQLENRLDLWRILVTITQRKAANLELHEGRRKRGGGRVVPEAKLDGRTDREGSLDRIEGGEPTPEFAALMGEQCRVLLEALPDESLRRVALLKVEGYTDDEIAARLGCCARTVVRKVAQIRSLWTRRIVP